MINIKEAPYFAMGNGVTDDTVAMMAAHATGALVYYPEGDYLFDKVDFFEGGIVGDGKGKTRLLSNNAGTDDLIKYKGTGGATAIPLFKDFSIQSFAVKPSGAGLRFVPTSGELSYAQLSGVLVYNCPRSVQFDAVAKFHMADCDLLNYTDAGAFVANAYNVDSGDSVIHGCLINTGQSSGNRHAVHQESGAGLKLIGNKILGGTAGYVLSHAGNGQSGPLLLIGNSIENVAGYAVYLGRKSGFTGMYGGVVIVGNEIAVCSDGVATDVLGGLVEFNISSNYISLNNATGKHVALNGVDKFMVGSNTFVGGATAVDITASCSNGKIGKNTYAGQSVATVSNASMTTFVDVDTQHGIVASITHNTAFGPLFHGATNVTFPTPFTVAPQAVHCNAGGGAGIAAGFGGYATNITKTGFTYNLVAVTAGATSGNTWSAEGVV
jgi:hypothetical protein